MHANRDSHTLSWPIGLASSFVQRPLLRVPPRVLVFLTLALPVLMEVGAARCCHVLSEVFDAPYHAISSSPSEMGLQAIYMLYATPVWHAGHHILSQDCAYTVVYSRLFSTQQIHACIPYNNMYSHAQRVIFMHIVHAHTMRNVPVQ